MPITKARRAGQRRLLLQLIACALLCQAQLLRADDKTTPAATAPTADPTDISLEALTKLEVPTVVAASKYEQKISEAPSSITVVTADEVKRYGYRTLAEILRSAPGLYTSYDRGYTLLGMRGFNRGDYNSRVLLLLDGHRINNSLSDSAYIGTSFILDPDLIDRVEIIRGPGSSLYGNNAFFGVINVVSRKGSSMPGLGGEVSAEAGGFETYKGRATFGHQFTNGILNGVEMLLSGSIYESVGDDRLYYKEFDQRISADPRASNNGIAEDLDHDSYRSFFGRIQYQDFTVQGAYLTREKFNPTAPNGTDFNDPRSRSTDDRSYASAKYAHSFEDVVDVTAQVYYDRHEFRQVYPYVIPTGFVFADEQASEWWGAELQLTKRIFDRHTITFGGEYRDDFRQNEAFRNLTTGTFTLDSRDRENYGIYLQGEFTILTNLLLSVGGRYDQYGDFQEAYNPRVALIYNPVGQTVFKAMYGTAFRAPNFFETRANPLSPGPPDPEKVTTYELVYEQGIGAHLRSSIAGFYNRIEDPIVIQPGGFYVNLQSADARGVELALDGTWTSGWRGGVSYTFQETKDRATGQWLSNSPRHLAKVHVSAPLWKDKVFAGLEVLYVSSRLTDLGTRAGDYPLVNFNIYSQNLVKGLEFSAGVYNIFDRKYTDPAPQAPTPHAQDVIIQDGVSFRVKMTYRF